MNIEDVINALRDGTKRIDAVVEVGERKYKCVGYIVPTQELFRLDLREDIDGTEKY